MKHIITSLFALLVISFTSNAQFFQATFKLDDVSVPKKLHVYIKANGGDINNIIWDRFEFFFRVPRTTNLPAFGTVTSNVTQFPGLSITKGGLNAEFVNAYEAESGKTNYYFPTSVPNGATNAARSFINDTEYEVFNVEVLSGDISDLEFVAEQVNSFPFYLTLSRVAVPSNMTASGPLAPPGAHVFYGGTTSKVGDVFIMTGGLLPVNFLSFYAMKNGDNAKLSWQVDGDLQNDYFEVLRSINGRDFKSIQKIEALENGQLVNSYQTEDFNINKLGGREVYYQIKQRDKDGQSVKSPVRMLSVDGLGKAVTAYPNPARTSTKLVVDAPEAGKGNIIMRDAIGRQVQVINAEFHRGINQFNLNVMNLSSGDYNIQVSGGGIQETIKLTKIN
jgi:hypothetical protein